MGLRAYRHRRHPPDSLADGEPQDRCCCDRDHAPGLPPSTPTALPFMSAIPRRLTKGQPSFMQAFQT
eukprot:1699406-Rhodomonas_salina.6